MIKENILEIKKLASDLHCMGTYGMVELELTKIENYIKELEGKVKNLTIPVVSVSACYFTDCLDQYKGECLNGRAWKHCKNRKAER